MLRSSNFGDKPVNVTTFFPFFNFTFASWLSSAPVKKTVTFFTSDVEESVCSCAFN